MSFVIVNRLRETGLVDQQRFRLQAEQDPHDGCDREHRGRTTTEQDTWPPNFLRQSHSHGVVEPGASPIWNLPPSERAWTVRSYIPSAYRGGTVNVPRFVGFNR